MMKKIFLAICLIASMAFAASENITINDASLQGALTVGSTFYCLINATSTLDTTLHIDWEVVKNGGTTINNGTNLTYDNDTWAQVGTGTLGTVVKGDKVDCKMVAKSPRDDDATDAFYSANQTIVNSAPTVLLQPTFVNASIAHWFTVTAGVSDADGGADIATTNVTSSSGSCTYLSNSTSGIYFNVTYNCTATQAGTATVSIGFTDADASFVHTNAVANEYPDNAPTLTPPTVSSPLYVTSTATCSPGTFADVDGDVENTSSRVWAWYKNGAVQGGQTASTVVLSAITAVKSNNIGCRQTTSADGWTSVTTTNLSANETVLNSAPTVSVQPAFTDIVGHKFNVTATATDADGGSEVTSSISVVSATCDYAENTTGATAYAPVYNCSSTLGATAYVEINFTDDSGSSVLTNNVSHAISNNAPATPTALLPNGLYNNTFSLVYINCTATDPDGDTLTYNIDYSNNSGANWTNIVTGGNNCTFTWNASSLPKLYIYSLRVNTSDGYLTNQSTSSTFTILPGTSGDYPYAIIAGVAVVVVASAYSSSRSGKKT